MHVFRYINGRNDLQLRFKGALRGALGGDGEGALECYVDSDYVGCPDDYKSTSGLVITIGGAVDWRSRKQMSTVQSTTDAKCDAFEVGCLRRKQILHHMNELGIPTMPHVFSDSESLIMSIQNRIHHRTAGAHIATRYYLSADIARDEQIDLSYIWTAEMLADCFTKPLRKPTFLKQCTAMGMIGIGLGNGLRNNLDMHGNGHRNGHGNGPRNGPRNVIGIGIGNGIGNTVGK